MSEPAQNKARINGARKTLAAGEDNDIPVQLQPLFESIEDAE